MVNEPQQGAGKKEAISLDSAAGHLLEECRMVLPGIQALFGFQLIAVFNDGFSQKLSHGEQLLHLLAIVLVVVAIGLDVYLIARIVFGAAAAAAAVALLVLVALFATWIALPLRERRKHV